MTDDPTPAEVAPWSALIAEVRGLRSDVQAERRGRRLTVRLFYASLFVIAVVLSGYVANTRAEQRASDRQACTVRVDGRSDVRAAIRAAVDEVAVYAEVPRADRVKLADRVRDRVLLELPTPAC